MTLKIFWDDPYMYECKAKVTSIEGRKVKLDQTIFYAESGGQESDEGSIGGCTVKTATKLGDKETIIDIEYELDEDPPFKKGDVVEVTINPVRREKLRNLHSATHIVYYFLEEQFGKFKTTGSHISQDKGRIEMQFSENITSHLPEIEQKVNAFLTEDHSIDRREDEDNPSLRWWSCEGWNMPCGGTHPKSTKEIGQVNLRRANPGAGKERVVITLKED